MKKALKIIGWVVLSLVVLVLLSVGVLMYVVFTPERLTPIVQKESSKLLTCEAKIERVELTFFSTFPNFGLRLDQVVLTNPMVGAPNDTLASLEYLTASVDLMAYLQEDRVVLNEFTLANGSVHLYTNEAGNSNYDIMQSSDSAESDTTSSTIPNVIDLKRVVFKDVHGVYVDESAGLEALTTGVDGIISFTMKKEGLDADAKLRLLGVTAALNDSVPMSFALPEMHLTASATIVDNHCKAKSKITLSGVDFKWGNDQFVDHQEVMIIADLKGQLEQMAFDIDQFQLNYGQVTLNLAGNVQLQKDSIFTDLTLTSNSMNIPYLLSLVPEVYTESFDEMDIDGNVTIDAEIKGIYADSIMPLVNGTMTLTKGTFRADFLPLPFTQIDAVIKAKVDLNNQGISEATIHHVIARTDESVIKLHGSVDDLMRNQMCHITLDGDLSLREAQLFLPDSLGMTIDGRTKALLMASFKLEDLTEMRLEKIKAKGDLQLTNFYVSTDSINCQTTQMDVNIQMPVTEKMRGFKPFLRANVVSQQVKAKMIALGDVTLEGLVLDAIISNPMSEKEPLSAWLLVKSQQLMGAMDTVTASIKGLNATLSYVPDKTNKSLQAITLDYSCSALNASMGRLASIQTEALDIEADALYNSNETELLLQWSPKLTVNLEKGKIAAAELPVNMEVPRINFDFSPGYAYINDSRILLGNSDFSLRGQLSNLDEYVRQTGLLLGDLEFESRVTDVNQIMELINGIGRTDSVVPMESAEDNPFMVPKGMDIALNTTIDRAFAGNGEFDNVGGRVTIKDGILILEQMGFTSKAAEMQLTAMYRSDRMNHLFAGVDFHLLNIDVAELINLIPDIDTIVPMLKAFEGKAEFHLAAETYLKSNYDLKMSTLRGAAAIEGKDLVLLDGETFSTIAKYMLFNNMTRNQVDTMIIEMPALRH